MAPADTPPPRGFAAEEYERRLARAQALMAADDLDAVVVTTPHNVRYFTGFASQFWESPTRPWFVVLPREGEPVAVVPEIGGPGFAATWVRDVRTWPAPQPEDDGLGLLASVFSALPRRGGRIGWEMGRESVIRMPIADFDRLRDMDHGFGFADASPLIWKLRMVKSPAEIAKIAWSCRLASQGFEALPARLAVGDTEHDVSRKFRVDLTERGVDAIPFMAVCSGPGGYDQIIVGPTERRLGPGDVLFIDLGAIHDGYSCDFDRNFSIGPPSDDLAHAHDIVWRATEAGIAAARPGATPEDLHRAMMSVLAPDGDNDLNVGRLGHGLGMQLTEPPSNMPGERVKLEPGMVMTIEPGLAYGDGRMIVHEENVVITEYGCELLTSRAPRELPVIPA